MWLPPGQCAEGPPWNPAEWVGRIVEENCVFTSFPNGLWLSVRSTFTNEHLFLLNPSFEHAHCIQNGCSLVSYHPCKIFPLWGRLKYNFCSPTSEMQRSSVNLYQRQVGSWHGWCLGLVFTCQSLKSSVNMHTSAHIVFFFFLYLDGSFRLLGCSHEGWMQTLICWMLNIRGGRAAMQL